MSDKGSLTKRSVHIVIGAIFVFLLTFLVYKPALKNDFVWDDRAYVYENTSIQSLNSQSLYRMLTSFHSFNWHPLTWLSHAMDYAFWGLDPLGHHLTNIILHGLNASLVFFLVIMIMLRVREVNEIPSTSKMALSISTKPLITAGITALLFGLHPLHVESVAWVAERKDLLCAFFVLLSIISYLSYTSSVVKRHRLVWFNICLLLFIFALMSKPMAVTLPVILLLLDIYPLNRISLYPGKTGKKLSVFLEKIPFFALSIASSIITIIAQHSGGAIRGFERFPISFRLLNALNSPLFYLKKMIWPIELIPFYPYPKYISPLDLQYIISGILILAITWVCLRMVKRGEYLFFTVWSYYLITLLPVIGIIQAGGQAAADRYTYLPSISLFLLVGVGVVWGWEKISLLRFKAFFRGLILVYVCTVVFLLSCLTINQIKIWQDSEILWSYVISAFPRRVPEAYGNLGFAYAKKGSLDEAISKFKKALAINPNYAEAHYNLGAAHYIKGELDKAISEFKKALTIRPNYAKAHTSLGLVYVKKGRFDKAISEYKKAIAINHYLAEAHYNLGLIYGKKGRFDEAISEHKKALTIKPNYAEVHYNLCVSYYYKGNYKLAIAHCDKAINLGYSVNPKLLELLKSYR